LQPDNKPRAQKQAGDGRKIGASGTGLPFTFAHDALARSKIGKGIDHPTSISWCRISTVTVSRPVNNRRVREACRFPSLPAFF